MQQGSASIYHPIPGRNYLPNRINVISYLRPRQHTHKHTYISASKLFQETRRMPRSWCKPGLKYFNSDTVNNSIFTLLCASEACDNCINRHSLPSVNGIVHHRISTWLFDINLPKLKSLSNVLGIPY